MYDTAEDRAEAIITEWLGQDSMSEVRSNAIAVCAADLHGCHKPPPIRGKDIQNWYQVQATYIRQLVTASNLLCVPILLAGDIFNQFDEQPELINAMIEWLDRAEQDIYAVPGQHDLPNHVYADIHKSAYETLVRAGTIENIHPMYPVTYRTRNGQNVCVYGFPWKHELKALDPKLIDGNCVFIALVHQYVWRDKKTAFEGAPEMYQCRFVIDQLKGFDIAIFGDNHINFGYATHYVSPFVYNCGGFIRRKSNESAANTSFGIVQKNSVIPFVMDQTHDKIIINDDVRREEDESAPAELSEEMQSFFREFGKLMDAGINFADFVKETMKRQNVEGDLLTYMMQTLSKCSKEVK